MAEQIGLEAVLKDRDFRKGMSNYMSGLGKMESKTGSAARRLGSDFVGVGNRVLKLAALLSGALVVGAAAGAAALATVAVSGTRMAADMEQQVADVRAIMGLAVDETLMLEELIGELGIDPNLKVSAVEAAAAIEMLGRNGLTFDEIMAGAARSTILLANATGAEFPQAADIGTDAMAIFGIKAEDMIDAVDGITSVTTNSKLDINDYALALGQAGGVAASVGVDFDDFNTALVATSPLFKSGADAGTSLRNFLQRLAPTSEVARKKMEELGIITEETGNRFFDAQGQMKDMDEIAGILQETTGDLSEEQLNMALTQIFGATAMRTAIGLANEGTEGFNEFADAMSETDAAEQAAIRMDTLRGAIDILMGVVESVKISIGNLFLPVLTDLTRGLTELVSNNRDKIIEFFSLFSRWVATNLPLAIEATIKFVTERLIPGLISLVNTFNNDVLPFLQKMQSWFQDHIPRAVDFIRENLDSLKGALAGIGAFLASAAIAALIAGIGTVIIGLLTPINLIIAAVGLFGAAWSGNWFGIRDTLTEVWEGTIQPALQTLIAFLQENVPVAIAAVSEWFNGTLMPILATFAGFVNETVLPAIMSIAEFLGTQLVEGLGLTGESMTSLQEKMSAAWLTIQAVVLTALTVIGAIIQAAVATFAPMLQTAIAGIQEALLSLGPTIASFRTMWATILEALAPIAAILGAVLVAAIGLLVGVVTGAMAAIGPAIQTVLAVFRLFADVVTLVVGSVSGALEILVALFSGNFAQVANLLHEHVEFTREMWGKIAGDVADLVSGLVDTVVQFIAGLVAGVIGFFTNLYDALVGGSIVPDIVNGVTSLIGGMVDTVVGLAQSLWAMATTAFENGKEAVSTVVGDVVTAVTGFFEELSETAVGVLEGMWTLISETFTTAVTTLSEKAAEIVTAITEEFESAVTAMVGIGSDIINGIITGINSAKETLRNILSGVADIIPAWLRAFLGIASPAEVLVPVGEAIVEGIILGIQETAPDIQSELETLFDFASAFSGLGSVAARRFKDEVLAPIEDDVGSIETEIDVRETNLTALLGLDDPSELHAHRFLIKRFFSAVRSGNTQVKRAIEGLWDAQNRRNAAEEEYAAQLEKINALEQAQADLKFLQQQLDLLDLIAEHGLNAEEILEGLTFGLDANLGNLLEAMTQAMQAIIQRTEEELQISSPSAVFANIGKQMAEGLAKGFMDRASNALRMNVRAQVDMLQRAPLVQPVVTPAPVVFPQSSGATTINEYNLNTRTEERPMSIRNAFRLMERLNA